MLSELKAAEITPAAAAATTAPADEPGKAATASSGAADEGGATTEGHDGEESGKEGAGKQATVPHGAFHTEREARKTAQAETVRLREQLDRQAQAQAHQQQEWQTAFDRQQQFIAAKLAPPPDEQADPLGAGLYIAKQTAQQVDQMRREQWQRDQHTQRQQWEQGQRAQAEQAVGWLRQTVGNAEAEFVKAQPDYTEALKFAESRRVKELTAAGFAPDHARQVALNDANNLVVRWVQEGRNPAATMYAMAREMGYTPAQTVDGEERLAMQEAGQKASKPSGGGTVRGRVSAQQIAAMTPTQLARLSPEDFAAAMGG